MVIEEEVHKYYDEYSIDINEYMQKSIPFVLTDESNETHEQIHRQFAYIFYQLASRALSPILTIQLLLLLSSTTAATAAGAAGAFVVVPSYCHHRHHLIETYIHGSKIKRRNSR